MIFINRTSYPVPSPLLSRRVEEARARILEVLGTASKAHLDQLSFRFESGIWISLRPALAELFNNKCAYCESAAATGPLDIEHFRPKQGALDLEGVKVDHLHYAWLAYDWDNLLLACSACNRMRRTKDGMFGKGSRFPTADARAAPGASVGECRNGEKGTLVDPCFDMPSTHMSFTRDGKCIPKTDRGAMTIGLVDLNRSELQVMRKDAMSRVTQSFVAFVKDGGSRSHSAIKEWSKVLADLVADKAPYAGATRACFEAECAERGGTAPPRSSSYNRRAAISAALRSIEVRGAKAPARKRTYKVATFEPVDMPETVFTPNQYGGRSALPEHAQRWLSRIEISNFKAIEQVVIDIPDPPTDVEGERAPSLMLLGENAAGKSSILEAIALALLGQREIKRLGIDGKEYLRRNQAWELVGEPAQVRLTLNGETEPSITLTIDKRSGAFRGPSREQTVMLGYGPRRFFSNTKRLRRKKGTAARLETLFDPLAIITNPSGWLMNASEGDYDAAVRALRQLLLLDEKSFVARPPRGQRDGKELMFELQGAAMPLKRLSEGYRTVVATAVDIMREMLQYWPNLEIARGVVLIDELDTHLHPRWKMRILQRLRQAMPGVQFIATTHDPLCLRGLFDGEVQVLTRLEGSVVEQVVDLPSVQGLTVEQLLTSDYFGLLSTEDPSVEEDLIRYVALATKDERTPDEEEELKLHRTKAQRRIRLGRTAQEQLVCETANAFVVGQRQAARGSGSTLKRATAKRMLDIWSGLDHGRGKS